MTLEQEERRMIFKVTDDGVGSISGLPGIGGAPPPYAMLATGSGSSARAAGADALELFWQAVNKDKITVAEAEALEKEIAELSPLWDAHDHCDHERAELSLLEQDEEAERCESAHLVTIRWNEEGRRRCAKDCQGLEIAPGKFSGCSCPEDRLANGQPLPPGFACDCPNHPTK